MGATIVNGGRNEGTRTKAIITKLKALGYDSIDSSWYDYIGLWRKWYEGYDPEFHDYETTADHKNDIQISSLHMGKTVCEDWASLLLGEKTEVVIEDDASSLFIQGNDDDDMQNGLFGETDFWVRANELVERAFALGLGAFIPRIKEAIVTEQGKITQGKIDIEYLTAERVIPLTWENRRITSCAVYSERAEGKTLYITLQIHEPGKITFKYYKSTTEGLVITETPTDEPEEIVFDDKSLFLPVFIYPQINNHISDTSPFGVSVYSTALDILKGTDLAYDNFNSDIELGRKMVFITEALMMTDGEGDQIAAHKTRKRLFQKVGEMVPGADKNPFIHEYNPDLRVEANSAAVQAQLDYLSFKCGLGQKYYKFAGGSVVTATQVVSDNSPLFRNRVKHNIVIQGALIKLTRNILRLAKALGDKSVNPETSITVNSDDAVITDTNTEKMQFMQEINAGIRQVWEYRVRFFGEDEATAKAMANGEDVVDTFNLKKDEEEPEGIKREVQDPEPPAGRADE